MERRTVPAACQARTRPLHEGGNASHNGRSSSVPSSHLRGMRASSSFPPRLSLGGTPLLLAMSARNPGTPIGNLARCGGSASRPSFAELWGSWLFAANSPTVDRMSTLLNRHRVRRILCVHPRRVTWTESGGSGSYAHRPKHGDHREY